MPQPRPARDLSRPRMHGSPDDTHRSFITRSGFSMSLKLAQQRSYSLVAAALVARLALEHVAHDPSPVDQRQRRKLVDVVETTGPPARIHQHWQARAETGRRAFRAGADLGLTDRNKPEACLAVTLIQARKMRIVRPTLAAPRSREGEHHDVAALLG